MIIQFKKWSCHVHKGVHNDGTTSLTLTDVHTGEPVASPTYPARPLLPGALKPGFILLKDYSENEGMLEALVSQGVVEDMKLPVPSGYVNLWLCKVLI